MKVLLLNGTVGRGDGLAQDFAEIERILNGEGIESEIISLGEGPVQGCVFCNGCRTEGKCIFEDVVNQIAAKLKDCDGLVIGSPVRMAAAPGELTALLSRLFTSAPFDMSRKVGAAVAEAKAGTLSTTYELNKYLAIAGMPIVSPTPGGKTSMAEGRTENIRSLMGNMIFLMRSIAMGKETLCNKDN